MYLLDRVTATYTNITFKYSRYCLFIMTIRTGVAELRLCEGYVPQYKEMVVIAYPFLKLLVNEYGTKEVVRRFSDPYWFQSFATALGFEHNYTGATTVTIKAVKEALNGKKDLGIKVVGGKGKEAINVAKEVDTVLAEISRETAKSDNTLMQDSYDLYFHSMIIEEHGKFAVINQGMNVKEQMVRRYHWYNPKGYESLEDMSLTCMYVLDLKNEKDLQKTMLDMVKDENPEKLERKILLLRKSYENFRKGNLTLLPKDEIRFFKKIVTMPYHLYFPNKLDVKALEVAKQAENFKEFFMVKGIGKGTLRGLAYLSALIYGKDFQWENPQQYCYAFGTKAGKPWYVERKKMREAAAILKEIAEGLDVETKRKKEVLKRLGKLIK